MRRPLSRQVVRWGVKRTISIPVGCGSLFAALHFLVVGVPFIVNHGGGEGLLYIILVDLPLFLISRLLAPYLLDNSVAFSFWTFVVGGTARAASVVVMTKDSDFADLVERLGSPPQVI